MPKAFLLLMTNLLLMTKSLNLVNKLTAILSLNDKFFDENPQ
ncbi:hypothetical protein Cyan10605_0545 [Cyanobacterium aponinum PCC 10605]|uniref:Uncharacterized protein n=1 Tax=Cyanobacterium aponinum (strain PCC 10605) TaxID=755178 RepID=K9Z0H9_CYAAP|nr:hypothetical protein Cyan10605_0545 [Cyanobacterium aponinum PCC 10605]